MKSNKKHDGKFEMNESREGARGRESEASS